jgi:predicted MFS family arabinose efflux permease
MDRFRLILVAQLLMAAQAFLLGLGVLAGWVDIWALFLMTLVHGIIVSFNQPARLSLVRSLVRTEDLPAAIAVNSVTWNSARFVGPAVAGVLIVYLEVGWSFVANGLTFLIFVASMLRIQADIPREELGKGGNVLQQIREGFVYSFRHAGMAPLLILLFVSAVFARPFAELLPGFSDAVFGRGADGLAMLTAATGAGAVIGGVWMSQAARPGRLTGFSLHSNAALALSLILFSVTESFWTAMFAVAVAGAGMTVHGVATQSLIQHACEPRMLGRVLSIYGLSFRAGPALGALMMGAASEVFGLQLPVAAGAAVCLAGWLWSVRRQGTIAERMGERA